LAPLPPPLSFLSYHQCPSSLFWSSFSPNNTTGLSPPAVRRAPPSGGAAGALDSCSADGWHQWCGRHPALRRCPGPAPLHHTLRQAPRWDSASGELCRALGDPPQPRGECCCGSQRAPPLSATSHPGYDGGGRRRGASLTGSSPLPFPGALAPA
jgi:hypothetical protein